jgi:hypothetical protein
MGWRIAGKWTDFGLTLFLPSSVDVVDLVSIGFDYF